MATSADSLQQRIADALNYQICHVKESDVPISARYDFHSIMDEISKTKPKDDEGKNIAWALSLNNDEAVGWARPDRFCTAPCRFLPVAYHMIIMTAGKTDIEILIPMLS